jgi:hypothetical protein
VCARNRSAAASLERCANHTLCALLSLLPPLPAPAAELVEVEAEEEEEEEAEAEEAESDG